MLNAQMHILIVEDETAATVNLLSIIKKVCPECRIVGTLESVADSLDWFANNQMPDVVFMDIHLADGDAFRIFDKMDITAPVIFTTAYDQYALEAFRVNSIDYLLKPIKEEDLRRSLEKLSRLTAAPALEYSRRIAEMVEQTRPKSPQNSFLAHIKDKIIPVRLTEVAFAYSSGDKVTVHTLDGREFPYEKSLDNLTGITPAQDFFRANRQFIISRKAIEDVSVWFGNRLCVNLRTGAPEKIIISKARVPVFKKWLTGELG